MKNKIALVSLNDIPDAIDAPTDKLIDLFRLITQMEHLCTEQNELDYRLVKLAFLGSYLLFSEI
jgi:hypothetical protein